MARLSGLEKYRDGRPAVVTNPSSNRARRSITSLMWQTPLPLCQTSHLSAGHRSSITMYNVICQIAGHDDEQLYIRSTIPKIVSSPTSVVDGRLSFPLQMTAMHLWRRMIAHCVDRATTFPSASAASSPHAHCLLPLSADLVMGRLAVFVHRLTIAADFTYKNNGSPPPFQNSWIHCTFTIHSLALRKTLYQLRWRLSQMRFINYNLRVSYGKKRHTEKKSQTNLDKGFPPPSPWIRHNFRFSPHFLLPLLPNPLFFHAFPFATSFPISSPFFPHISNFDWKRNAKRQMRCCM